MSYIPGDRWLLCDQCQRKMRLSKSAKRWDGRIVHADPNEGCMESRHPQDFVRNVRDMFPVEPVRPDNEGIESTQAINCTGLVEIPIPYIIEADLQIYKGRTELPPHIADVIIQNNATVTVHCTWTIEVMT